MFLGSEWLRK